MADKFKKIMHKICGIGGIKCDCCNMYSGKNRRYLKKLARNKLKQEDNKKYYGIVHNEDRLDID